MAADLSIPQSVERVKPVHLAAVIMRQDEHFAQDIGGGLYIFKDGFYQFGADAVRRWVKRILHENGRSPQWSSRLADETVEYLRVDSPRLLERPPGNIVNVQNGLLYAGATNELRPHDPRILTAVQLPVRYDPEAQAPKWEEFIARVFPSDAVEAKLAWYILAWLMLPLMQFQKALLLLGKGGTGKSTFLKLLCRFLGNGNCSHLSLADLQDRFRPAQLLGKLLNAFADLPAGILKSTDAFRLVTGEDPVTGEYKFGQPFSFYPFARLCFSANVFPRVQDAGEQFFDRWLVVRFNNKFRGTGAQVDQEKLIADLTSPEELSGALNHALEVLPDLLAKGFPLTESSRRGAQELEAQSSPVRAWFTQHVALNPCGFVPKNYLLQTYNASAIRTGLPMLTDTAFSIEVKKHFGTSLGEGQRTIDRGRRWVWTGIVMNQQLSLVEGQREVV